MKIHHEVEHKVILTKQKDYRVIMVVKVFLWKSSSKKSFGHISMELEDGTYISWWPETRMEDLVQAAIGTNAKWFESLNAEINHNQASPTETFYLLGLNEGNIKVWFQGYLSGSCKWDIMTRSCAAIVYHALCEGADFFAGKATDIVTPEGVAELVRRYTTDKKVDKVVVSSCKPKIK
ncbi:hypothetical protein DPMN_045399 [Dreissena polymorpha]|uniref:Uncharacterized protein n=1 Tax=Dreissena polymorpha TaxID=45954 RepID=A0A9D4D6H5_DREPO|nr:hypothetical protein DPMN_045399 [Dreissena polymorpha]